VLSPTLHLVDLRSETCYLIFIITTLHPERIGPKLDHLKNNSDVAPTEQEPNKLEGVRDFCPNEDWTIQFHHETGVSEFQCTGPRGSSLWIGAWRAILDRGTPSSTGRLLTLPTPAVRSSCSATGRCGGRLAMLSLPTPSPRPPDIISQLIKERAVHGLRRSHDAYSTTSH
jgi:hypothetical protein